MIEDVVKAGSDKDVSKEIQSSGPAPFENIISIQIAFDKWMTLNIDYNGKVHCDYPEAWRKCARMCRESNGKTQIEHGVAIAGAFWLALNQGIEP
jgi:hypothetical protein